MGRLGALIDRLDLPFPRAAVERYGSQAFFVVAERGLRQVAGLLVSIVVARVLGPARYGELSYAIALATLASVVISLGLDQITVVELVRRPDEQDRILGSVALLRLGGFGLAMGLLGLATRVLAPARENPLLVWLVGLGFVGLLAHGVEQFAQARVDMKRVALVQITLTFLAAAASLGGAAVAAPVWFFALAQGAGWLLTGLGWVIAYQLSGGAVLRWRANGAQMLDLLRRGLPLLASSGLYVAYMRIDQLLVESYLGVADLGIWAIVVRLNEAGWMLTSLVTMALFPAIVSAHHSGDRERYELRLRQLYGGMIWLTVPLVLVMALVSFPLMRLGYGSAFASAGSLLAVYSVSMILHATFHVCYRWAVCEERYLLNVLMMATAVALNVVGNCVLLPRWGLWGALAAALAALPAGMAIVLLASPEGRRQLRLVALGVAHGPRK